MTIATPSTPSAAIQPAHQLLQDTLEERYRVFVQRLAQLTVCTELPDRGGYDATALTALLAWARSGVADAAAALQRMSQGTYGVCERCRHDIPVGYLRNQPDARTCAPCERRQPMSRPAERSAPGRQLSALGAVVPGPR
jgi:DnaK suppressor protein